MTIETIAFSGGFKISSATAFLSAVITNASPLVITPTAGKKIRLDSLGASTGSIAADISGSSKGSVISGDLADKTVSPNEFRVGNVNTDNTNGVGFIPPIEFEVDEVVTISTTDPSVTIYYAYSEGV